MIGPGSKAMISNPVNPHNGKTVLLGDEVPGTAGFYLAQVLGDTTVNVVVAEDDLQGL